jgi:hypothetical protein
MRNVGLRRFALALTLAAALGAPFVVVVRAGHAALAPLTEITVAALLRLTAPLAVPVALPPPASGAEVEVAVGEPTQLAVQRSPKSVRARKAPTKAPSALFVSRAKVLALAQSAARPRGSFVAKTALHPAGLQLSGVAALGIGLQDGDILIEAMGIAPRASGEIVGAVVEARARRAEALSGTIWRRGQTFRITVQQPY